MLEKLSGSVNCFHEFKYISFLKKDKELLEAHDQIRDQLAI